MIYYSKKKSLKEILGSFFSSNEKKETDKSNKMKAAKEEMLRFSKDYHEFVQAEKSLSDAYHDLKKRKN
jgi:hypothetical protein